MKKHIIKSLIAVSFTLPAFAAQGTTQAKPDPNPCARWGTNSSSNLYASVEALFLKPLFSSFPRNQIVSDPVTSQSTVYYTAFGNKFTPAVRALVGCNTSWDGWDLNLIYTGLDYSYSNAYFLQGKSVDSSGTQNQKFYYNQGDLDLGRMCKVSSKLKLRPHVGVRALWLVQKTIYNYSLTGLYPKVYTIATKANGRLIGAEAGLDSFWKLSKEFSAYANAGITTLVNSQNYRSDNITVPPAYFKTNKESRIVNGYDFAIGLRWDRDINNNNYHVALNFGYEHHNLVNLNSNSSRGFTNFRDFSMQGIALGLRFDF